MNHDPALAFLGLGLARQQVLSARPDAPVVPDRPRRHPLRATRARVASGLHRLAWRIEPAPVRDRARPSVELARALRPSEGAVARSATRTASHR